MGSQLSFAVEGRTHVFCCSYKKRNILLVFVEFYTSFNWKISNKVELTMLYIIIFISKEETMIVTNNVYTREMYIFLKYSLAIKVPISIS